MSKPTPLPFKPEDVVAIARRAGVAIMEELNNLDTLVVEEKADKSIVMSADHRANEQVLAGLRALTPDIPILSEEMSPEEQAEIIKQPRFWCVDPLDGTATARAYARGEKHYSGFGTLIGLVENGVPVFGVTHYSMNEQGRGASYFTNAAGTEAYRQIGDDAPQRIRCVPAPRTGPLRVANGFRGADLPALCGRDIESFPDVGGCRLIRTAEGFTHASYMGGSTNYSCGYWDVAGPMAIVRAAGGDVRTLPGGFAEHAQADALEHSESLRFDGRHRPAHMPEGSPYIIPSIAAHRESFRTLGAPGIDGRGAG